MKYIFTLSLGFFICIAAKAANTNNPNVKVCTQSYTSIGNIVLTETANNDFPNGNNKYLFINAPTGFEFNPGAGSVNASAPADISGETILFVSTSTIAIFYNVTAETKSDVLTISGIQIKATSVSGTTSNFLVSTGSSSISGLGVGTILFSAQSAISAINLASVSAKCNNDAAVALNGTYTLNGGTYNTQSYSGTGVSGSNFNPVSSGAGNFTVTYTMTTTSPSCTFTKSIAIDVNAAPVVTLITEETSGNTDNDGVVCTGAGITFTGYGANSYKFYKASGPTLLNSSSPYTTSSLSNGDVIYVEGTATNGCKDNSPNKTITVNALPAAPTFNPTASTFSSTDAGFWLDTLGSPSEEANRTNGSPSYFTGTGVVYDSGDDRYYFYPNIAGDGSYVITYHYVNPATGCESTTNKTITVGTGVSAGAIQNINTKYCINDAAATIYIDFCNVCLFGCTTYQGMQYSLNGGATWTDMTLATSTSMGSCLFGPTTRYEYTLNPATLGAGVRLFRYYYESYVFFSGYVTNYSSTQSTTIYALPTISITNAFSAVMCSDNPATVLTFSANGASGTGVFSSTIPGFITTAGPNYQANWSVVGTALTAANKNITLTFTDNVSNCVSSTTSLIPAALKPSAPTAYSGTFFSPTTFPYTFCKTDYTYGVSNVTTGIGMNVQWIKDAPGNLPSYTDTYYPDYYDFSYFPRGYITANEVYFLKQYIYPTCVSNASAAYNFTVNDPVSVNIGQYSTVCSNQTISLNKLQKSGPTVTQTWSTITAPTGSFDNASSNSPTYTLNATDIARGSVTFRVTTSDPDGASSGCPVAYKDTIVYINELPIITASSSAATYCSNSLMFLSASVNKSSATPVTWYKGPIVSNVQTGINTPTSISTYFTPNSSEKNGGSITFYVESADPDGTGPCSAVNDNVTITINPEAIVDAGASDTICQGSNINLSGTCTKFGGATLGATWYDFGVSPWSQVVAAGTNPKTATYIPTVAENNGTTITFYLYSDDPDGAGPCGIAYDDVKVQIDKLPTISAGSDATVCSNSTISISSNSTGAASVTWYKNSVGGTQVGLSTPTVSNTNYSPTVSEKSGSTITFAVQTDDPFGPCPAVSDFVDITINPEAVVNAGLGNTICGGSNINLSGTCTLFGGANLAATWYDRGVTPWNQAIGAGTNPKAATYIPTLAEAAGTTMRFYLTSNDPDGAGPCLADSSFVDYQINQAPTVVAGADNTYCTNQLPSISASLGGSATGITWSKNAGSGTIVDVNSTTTNYIINSGDYSAGTTLVIDFTATTNDPDGPSGPCVAVSDIIQITLNPHLTVNPGSDIEVCANQTINLNGTVKIGGALRTTASVNDWKTFDGAGGFTLNGPSNFTGTYDPSGVITTSGSNVVQGTGELGLGDSIFVYLVSTDPDNGGPCLADSARINIKINPLPLTHFDAATKIEYCGNNDPITLKGNLGSDYLAPGNKSSASFSGGTYIVPSVNSYEFHPKKAYLITANGGPRTVTYTYNDANGCQNHVDTTFDVYPYPLVDFNISTLCEKDTITFTQNANISNTVYGSSNYKFDWLVDGDSTQNAVAGHPSSLNTPSTQYSFFNYGLHNIKLFVTSSNGAGNLDCYNQKDSTRIFGPYPNTKYSWDRACSVDSVVFQNLTQPITGYNTSTTWNMNGLGTYKNATNSGSQNPRYKFDVPGIYNVSLDITTTTYGSQLTNLNCKTVLTKEVFVLPSIGVTSTTPYNQTFASSDLYWAPSGTNYSWDWGPMSKSVITSSNNAWATNLSGNYNVGELSYLNSPCFNFKTLDKPMVALKLWSNSTNLAGAMLEATSGYGQPWVTVGSIGDGLNWYNTSGIVGLIGTNSTNPLAEGFSGENTDWGVSRIGLSQFALQDSLVRFRIVFGSSNVNDPLNSRDGIAFDSVWIGNRTKVVMMEHFTNSSASVSALTTPANTAVDNIRAARPADVAVVSFHTSFPSSDPYSAFNFSDPGSRVLYYGVSAVPRTVVDGTYYNGDVYTGGTATTRLDVDDVDAKALETALFDLDVNSNFTAGAVNVGVKATYVVNKQLNNKVILHTVVIEDSASGVNSMNAVVRKMLPNAAGVIINRASWQLNDTESIYNTWTHSLPGSAKLGIVTYIQDAETKEIYQAKYVRGSQTSAVVDGTNDASLANWAIQLFPNPAQDEAIVLYGDGANQAINWQLIDGLGKVVDLGNTSIGSQGFTLNTKDQAAGVYTLRLSDSNGVSNTRKLVIVK